MKDYILGIITLINILHYYIIITLNIEHFFTEMLTT